LICKRYADQLEQQRRASEDTLKRQEESVQKQEQIRQQTIAKEMQMREHERKNRIKEEAEVKAKVMKPSTASCIASSKYIRVSFKTNDCNKLLGRERKS